jgi:hypothetical protein
VKENIGLGVLQGRHQQSAILGFLCLTALILSGCDAGREMAEPADAASGTLPDSSTCLTLSCSESSKAIAVA